MDKLMYEVIGFLCGYLLILLSPNSSPFEISDLLMRFIVNPFLFFILMMCFLIGFLSHSIIVKASIESTYRLIKGHSISLYQAFINYSLYVGYFFLFIIGPWEAVLLLAFSLMYGIISVDLKKNHVFDVDR
ncbi:hypothetical protein ACLM5H_04620 [Fredinandcohnia humi]